MLPLLFQLFFVAPCAVVVKDRQRNKAQRQTICYDISERAPLIG